MRFIDTLIDVVTDFLGREGLPYPNIDHNREYAEMRNTYTRTYNRLMDELQYRGLHDLTDVVKSLCDALDDLAIYEGRYLYAFGIIDGMRAVIRVGKMETAPSHPKEGRPNPMI